MKKVNFLNFTGRTIVLPYTRDIAQPVASIITGESFTLIESVPVASPEAISLQWINKEKVLNAPLKEDYFVILPKEILSLKKELLDEALDEIYFVLGKKFQYGYNRDNCLVLIGQYPY